MCLVPWMTRFKMHQLHLHQPWRLDRCYPFIADGLLGRSTCTGQAPLLMQPLSARCMHIVLRLQICAPTACGCSGTPHRAPLVPSACVSNMTSTLLGTNAPCFPSACIGRMIVCTICEYCLHYAAGIWQVVNTGDAHFVMDCFDMLDTQVC